LEGLALEDVGKILWTLGPFYGLLLYFMDIWYSSWKFGNFFRFGILYQEKSGNPADVSSECAKVFTTRGHLCLRVGDWPIGREIESRKGIGW
jgi:hypothetical protein